MTTPPQQKLVPPQPTQSPYTATQAAPQPRVLDPDAPLPEHLYPNGRTHRSPAPATYQPIAEAELSRSPGASAVQNAAEGVPPTPRYSRSPRKDATLSESPRSYVNASRTNASALETIPDKVRRLSASPDRTPRNAESDGVAAHYVFPLVPNSSIRNRHAVSVGGTELLPAYPALQGQSDVAEIEKERSYRTIVKFIERQPEVQRRELKKLYIDEYTGKEEDFVALLSEAYGEDFEAMKSGLAIGVGESMPMLSSTSGGGAATRSLGFGQDAAQDSAGAVRDATGHYGEGHFDAYAEGEAPDEAYYPDDQAQMADEEAEAYRYNQDGPSCNPHEGQVGAGYGAGTDDGEVEDEIQTPPVPVGL